MDYKTLLVIASAIMQVIIDYQTMKGKTEDEVKAMFAARYAKFHAASGIELPEPFLKGGE